MENLVKHYIQEAKEGIEIDGEVISLLNKKESETILKKHGITNQTFAQVSKMVMDYYSEKLAGNKASGFINNDEIKAKFPDAKYVQDITLRSYLCHVIEVDKGTFDNASSDTSSVKKEAVKDLSLNLAVVQLKKIYKINSLKFSKILNKAGDAAITSAEVKATKTELEKQIKTDKDNIIPDNVKDIMVDKTEKITPKVIKDIKNEIKKIDIVIDENAIRNVNKYLSAIKETFNFLTLHFKGISIKNLDKSKKILEDAQKAKDQVFISKIEDILKSLGNINSYAMKENFDNMNVLAWCNNVLNLKAYHTSSSDLEPISNELEKKVVSILNRYKPAQRNSYDAYHLVEDFIEICRDHTGEIKLSHQITDLMLIEVLKDFMKKTNDQVNLLLTVSNKTTKVKNVEVERDDEGDITKIINNTTEIKRRKEVEKMIGDQFKTASEARKFFFDLYNNQTTFNGKSWGSLTKEVQNSILKAAKINKSSAEYLDIKLNRRIEKKTGTNPIVREQEIGAKEKESLQNVIFAQMNDNARKFIKKFDSLTSDQIETFKIKYKYGSRFELIQRLVEKYKTTGIVNAKAKDIFDKSTDEEYKFIHKVAELNRIIPRNGAVNTLFESNETPLLNRYLGMLNENN